MGKELENYCKLALILNETGSKVLNERIKIHCDEQSITFEQFLARHQHDLFHMWQLTKCCQCDNDSTFSKKTLYERQFYKLYGSIGAVIQGHHKKGRQVCSCHILPVSGIQPDDMDITFAVPILLELCKLEEWEIRMIKELRDLRNEIIGHPSTTKVTDEDFQFHLDRIVCAVMAIAKGCKKEFHGQVCQELKDIQFKPLTVHVCNEQVKLIRTHYAFSRCLFEKLYGVIEMTKNRLREIPEELQQVIEIIEPINREIADELKLISNMLSKPMVPDKSSVKRQLAHMLRQLNNIFSEEDTEHDKLVTDTEEKSSEFEDSKKLEMCSSRENNIALAKMEIDVHKNSTYIPVRAVGVAEKKLSKEGIVVFTGKPGSAKSTHSLELLHRTQKGNVFHEPHDILHLSNIEDWEHLVIPSKNTVVFLDDPLGKTTANSPLIHNDNGIFQKIWACVKGKHVKVIMTIRTNIFCEYFEELDVFDLFQSENIVDLSTGDLKLNDEEKIALFSAYCNLYQVKIVKTPSEENIESGEVMKHCRLKISETTVQKIIQLEPPIGFPLCTRNFLRNKMNTRLGLRYFKKPTEALLREMESLAKSKNSFDRTQFVILVLVMLAGGKLSVGDLTLSKLLDVSKHFHLLQLHQTLVEKALKKLKQKFLLKTTDGNIYRFCHDTTSEAIFDVYIRLAPHRIDALLQNADKTIIYERIRTKKYLKKDDETILIIEQESEETLVERFISELKKDNFRDVILHPAMKDCDFRSIFMEKLKKPKYVSLIKNQQYHGYSVFTVACIFDISVIVHDLLEIMSAEEIDEGLRISLKFENHKTISTLLSRVSQKVLNEAVADLCRKGNTEVLELFFQEDIKYSVDIIKTAFSLFCYKGKVDAMCHLLTHYNDIYEELVSTGFPSACRGNSTLAVSLLLDKTNYISNEQIKQRIRYACFNSDDEKLLERIFKTYATVLRNMVTEVFGCLCLAGNKSGISWILEQRCLSNEDVIDSVAKLSKSQKNTTEIVESGLNDNNAYYFEQPNCYDRVSLNAENYKIRSHSLESSKSRSSCNIGEKQFKRLRSISDSDHKANNVEYYNYQGGQNENNCERTIISDEYLSTIIKLVLSKRRDISEKCLGDLLVLVCSTGKLECLKTIMEKETLIPPKNIVEGIHVASCNNYPELLKYVLQNRCSFSVHELEPIFVEACELGHIFTIQILLEKVSIFKISEQVEEAALKGRVSTVSAILSKHITLPARIIPQAFRQACKSNNIETMEVILDLKQEEIPKRLITSFFLQACNEGNIDKIKVFKVKCPKIVGTCILKGLKTSSKLNQFKVTTELLQFGCAISIESLTEVLIIACLFRSIETIEVILANKTLPVKSTIQILLVCLHSYPSLLEVVANLSSLKLSKEFEVIEQNYLFNVKDLMTRKLKRSELISFLMFLANAVKDDLNSIAQCNIGLSENVKVRTCSFMLAFYGARDTVTCLLKYSPFMSSWCTSEILQTACVCNNTKLARTILQKTTNLQTDDLIRVIPYLCQNRNVKCLEIILTHKPDIQECDLLSDYVTACHASSTDVVETILKAKADLTEDFVMHGLTTAVIHQVFDTVCTILQHRLDISKENISVLCDKACEIENNQILNLLIQYRREVSDDILADCFSKACFYNRESIVKTILATTKIHPESLVRGFKTACNWDNTDTLKVIADTTSIPSEVVQKEVTHLCLSGNTDSLFQIINQKPKIYRFGFLKACEYGRSDVVKKMLRSALPRTVLGQGIIVASKNNRFSVVRQISKSRKHISLRKLNISKTILSACRKGNEELVDLFFRCGYNANACLIEKCFQTACGERNSEIVAMILDYWQEPNLLLIHEQLEIACEYQVFSLIKTITERIKVSYKCLTKLINRAFGVNSLSLVLYIMRTCKHLSAKDFYGGLVWLELNNYHESISNVLGTRNDMNSKYMKLVTIQACNDNNIAILKRILLKYEYLEQVHLRQILLKTCFSKKYELVQLILEMRPKISTSTIYDIASNACEANDIKAIDVILKIRCDLSKQQAYSLFVKAAEKNQYEIIISMLSNLPHMSIDRILPITDMASVCNRSNTMTAILKTKRDISTEHVIQMLFKACESRGADVVRSILHERREISDKQILQLLGKAIKIGSIDVFEAVIETRPDITSEVIQSVGKMDRISNICDITNTFMYMQHKRNCKKTLFHPLVFLYILLLYWVIPFPKEPLPLKEMKSQRLRKTKRKKRQSKKSCRHRLH